MRLITRRMRNDAPVVGQAAVSANTHTRVIDGKCARARNKLLSRALALIDVWSARSCASISERSRTRFVATLERALAVVAAAAAIQHTATTTTTKHLFARVY